MDSGRRFYASFGNAHAGLWQAAYRDGQVARQGYDVDIRIASRMANRKDDLPATLSN